MVAAPLIGWKAPRIGRAGRARVVLARVTALAQGCCFRVRVARADLANFFLLQYPGVDGFLVTGKNSGTHWVKFMLSCAIAEQFGVPVPAHASGPGADSIIGHPSVRRHGRGPRIGSSHTIPSLVFAWRFRLFDHPPVVVLVRDIPEAMTSNFLKWQPRYNGSFSRYVRGDPLGRRHVADLWWYVHFFNRWGDVARARPETTLIVRYEDVRQAPEVWLRRIAAHLRIGLDDRAIAAALVFYERAALRPLLDPAEIYVVIPGETLRGSLSFSPADQAVVSAIMARHLRHDFGYGYPVRGADEVGLGARAKAGARAAA